MSSSAGSAEPGDVEPVRSDLMVKLRGASYGDRDAVLDEVRSRIDEHTKRRSLYEFLESRGFPNPGALFGRDLDHYLVLRAGLFRQEYRIRLFTEYLTAHERQTP